ncbi:MAG: hypothetical protein ABMA64_26690 [Myxococcota bacterium]
MVGSWVVAVAGAQAPALPPDVSVTSLGVQTWSDSALRELGGATDADLQLGERLRWTLAGEPGEGSGALLLVDARFTVDPASDATALEWSQVRQLGVEVLTGRWTVDLGRSLVYRGGPRLVDGAQALYAPSPTVRVGVWGGLLPDLFTTRGFESGVIRPGGGPIVVYETSSAQLSAVGEVATYDGAIDRVGALVQSRYSFERALDLAGRVDAEVQGPVGARLVDALLSVGSDPSETVHVDAMYDAFSSYRYQGSETLDPRLQRFADRMQQLGIELGITQDTRDPTLNHLVGASARYRSEADGLAPRFGLTGRYRYHPNEDDRYVRVNPAAGLAGIGGVVDLTADANYLVVGGDTQVDGGLLVYLEPADGAVAVDASARLIWAPEQISGLGYYTDLYLNLVSPDLDLLFIAGVSAQSERDLTNQDDVGFGAFVRMAKYLRHR